MSHDKVDVEGHADPEHHGECDNVGKIDREAENGGRAKRKDSGEQQGSQHHEYRLKTP